MVRAKLALVALIVVAGVGLGLALPRWRMITIVFEPGGRDYHLENGQSMRLPATMDLLDDGRLRLRVVNRDSVGHAAGVLGLPARDSAIVSAELCTGTHEHGARTIVLR